MHIRGVSLDWFDSVVDEVSATYYAGNVTMAPGARPSGRNSITTRLRVTDSWGAGARTSASGRHGPYACWHAYRDVLAELFRTCPDATVRTAMETYWGREGFLRTYPATAHRNIGSERHPTPMTSLCVRSGCGNQRPPSQPQVPEDGGDDILTRITRELRRVDQAPPAPLVFEGPDSLLGVPDLAYSGR